MSQFNQLLPRHHLLAISKGAEKHLLAFSEADFEEAVAYVIRLAIDPRFSFDYSDLLTILRQMKRLLCAKPHARISP